MEIKNIEVTHCALCGEDHKTDFYELEKRALIQDVKCSFVGSCVNQPGLLFLAFNKQEKPYTVVV